MTQDPPQPPLPDGPPPPAAPPDGPPLPDGPPHPPAEPPPLTSTADETAVEPEPSVDETPAEPEPTPDPPAVEEQLPVAVEPPAVEEPPVALEPPAVEALPVALEPPTVGAPLSGFHQLGGAAPPVAMPVVEEPLAAEMHTLAKAPPARRRKRRWLIVTVVVAVVVVLGGGGAAAYLLTRPSVATVGPPSSQPPSTGSGAPAQRGTAYTDPNRYYTAQFDGAPTYHSTQQSTSTVGNVPYLYAEYIGPDVDQLVGVLVFDPGTTFDAQRGLQGIANAAHGSVVSSSPSTFQTFPSLEGVITLSGEYLKVQLVHTGNLAYVIGTAGPVNPPSDYQRFIASVHVTPH